MAEKLVDTKFVEVIVENRDPESEERSCFVGGNNIIIDGKNDVVHYQVQLGEPVKLPEPFIEQLKTRAHIVQDKKTLKNKHVKLYTVEVV